MLTYEGFCHGLCSFPVLTSTRLTLETDIRIKNMDFGELVFWIIFGFGGVGRYMGWVTFGDLLKILELIIKFSEGREQGRQGGN